MSDLTELTPAQTACLDRMLRNESDVAYRRRVKRMVAYLGIRPGDTVLDCGTGMGFYIKVLQSLYPDCRFFGIDRENRVLSFARDHLDGQSATLTLGDIERLPFADASFDRVVMSEVLEHLDDDVKGLREVARVLKPGGVLAVTVPNTRYPAWYDPISRVAESVFHHPIRTGPFAGIWANHKRLYAREGLVRLIEENGFEAVVVEELTHYCFPATQTLVYTVGKELIEHNLLPEGISRSTHRFRGEENTGGRLNLLNWALAVIDWFDRLNLNQDRLQSKRTFVNVAVKARKQ